MTRFPIALFVFSLICVLPVFAQYPRDETVDPYPKPVKEKILVKRFECDAAELPQWKTLHQTTISTAENRLRIESTGSDPYVLMSEMPQAETGAFEFRIRMKNGMSPRAEIFWSTAKEPGFRAENAVRFGFVSDFERTETYAVRFETDAPLTRLRFDPGTSAGVCEIGFVELYKIVFDDTKEKNAPVFNSNWAPKAKGWNTISSGNVEVRFGHDVAGAQIFIDKEHVGDIYPLLHVNPKLPLGGIASIPLLKEEKRQAVRWDTPILVPEKKEETSIVFSVRPCSVGFVDPVVIDAKGTLEFSISESGEIRFECNVTSPIFGPVFRPKGEMTQAVLNGVEYLEKGEHSSSTADLETDEHFRFAPKSLDVTWPFMSIVTEKVGFGLLWDDPETQAVFATPDFIFGDKNSHYMGLHGTSFAGTVKISPPKRRGRSAAQSPDNPPNDFTDLEDLLLWGIRKHGLPELPNRFRDDELQRLLNLAAFEKSMAAGPTGWQHAATPGVEKQFFSMNYGNDFVSVVRQLSGKLPKVPRLDHGGGHLRNPASFFLMGKANEFLDWTRNETKHLLSQQKDDGSFRYAGKYLKGHWEDTASGHCGNALYRLMYNYRMLGDETILPAVRKGLDFANRYPTPRGAQVWELSLHTPDIMGSSRMCMANVWFYEATGEKPYLDAARRWAVTGLPFVYFWTSKTIKSPAEGAPEVVMNYATIPVFGATNWSAPNWIGLPVQWCGLDYGEALFMLAEHDQTVDWKKIAEGILIAAEQMQYPDGISVGLLPDSFVLSEQRRAPHDINPSVLVMQRRRLHGKVESVDVAVSADKKFRIVSPFKTTFEADGKAAVIEAETGTNYQILINGKEIRTIDSKGKDRIEW